MPSPETTIRSRRVSDHDLGFRLGIAVAVGFLVHGHGEDSMAKELLQVTDVTVAKTNTAGATEYDISAMRKALR